MKTFKKLKIVFLLVILLLSTSQLFNKTFGQNSNDSTYNYFTITEIQDAYYDSLIAIRGCDSMRGTGYKNYFRWKAFMGRRYGTNGNLGDYKIAINNYYKNYQNTPDNFSNWQYLGPIGVASTPGNGSKWSTGKGMITSVYIDPDNHNKILAGAHTSGLWKTENGGDSWIPLTDNYHKIDGISSIVVNPLNKNIIYITSHLGISKYSNGVFKSIDGGVTWNELYFEDENGYPFFPATNYKRIPRKLIMHPENPDTLFLITHSYIFKTTDGGEEWQIIRNEDFIWWNYEFGFYDIEFDTENPSTIYVSGHIISKSTDGGETWIDITDLVLTGQQNDTILRTEMSVNENYPGKVWFLFNNIEDSVFLVKFDPNSSPNYNLLCSANNTCSFLIDNNKIECEVSPTDENTVYLGGLEIYKYNQSLPGYSHIKKIADGGASPDQPEWVHVDIRDMKVYIDTSSNDKIFVGCDGGVSWGKFVGGNNYYCDWTDISDDGTDGLHVTEFYGIASSNTNPNLIVGGTQDLSSFVYDNGEWFHTGFADGGDAFIDYLYPNYVYMLSPCCGRFPGILRSNNKGINLYSIYTHPPVEFFSPIEMHPTDNNILYYGENVLWKFTDVRKSKDKVDLNLGNDMPITDVTISQSSPDIIYAADKKVYYSWDNPPNISQFDSCIWRSNNGGNTWIDISSGLGGCYDGFITDIEIHPNYPDSIWVGFALATGNLEDEKAKKVYCSDNGGSSWTPFVEGLHDSIPVHQIKYDVFSNLLFIATDIGVFYRDNNINQWVEYNNNLPYKLVTDIEINYTANKIRAGTYGRGLWESVLPDSCPPYSSQPIEITYDTTWSKYNRVHRDIIIKPGNTLTIESNVYMHSNAKIIVERGAKLLIDGGLINNSCDGGMWKGIEVWGNINEPQIPQVGYQQGIVELKNNASIINALIAISTIKREDDIVYEEYSGGIILAEDATFLKNEADIEFFPYENHHPVDTTKVLNNLSYFKNCLFNINKELINSTTNPLTNIVLKGVRGIDFKDCEFISNKYFSSELSTIESSMVYLQDAIDINFLGCTIASSLTHHPYFINSNLGTGILSINSSFTVDEYCISQTTPCTEYKPSYFNNLSYGIKAYGINTDRTVTINKCIIEDVGRGIYLNGITNATITYDSLILHENIINYTDTVSYGIYLDYCTGYTVEENTVSFHSVPYYQLLIGIIINNSGSEFNMIYNNYFKGLKIGTLAQNNNRSKDGLSGLQIKCNDYYLCEYDIAVTQEEQHAAVLGIKYHQGSNIAEATAPANCTFSYTHQNPTSDYHNECLDIIYWHLKDTITANTKPKHYSIPQVNPQENPEVTDPYNKQINCPSSFNNGGGGGIEENRSAMLFAEHKIDSTQNLLNILVDGGDTDCLDTDVQTSLPDEALEVRNELIAESPYLSDTVMVSAVNKENVLTSAMVTEILIANPQSAKSDTVQQVLDSRINLLSEDQRTDIDQGWFVISAKESLEAKLSHYKSERKKALNNAIRYFRNDTISPSTADSIIILLESENSLGTKYSLAFEYLTNDDTISVQSTLNSIPNNFNLTQAQTTQHQHYEDYFNILLQLNAQCKNIFNIDSIQKSTLYTILNSSTGILKSYIRNILIITDTIAYNEPYILPGESLKSGKIRRIPISKTYNENRFILYPNPAGNYMIVEYTLKSGTHPGSFVLLYDNTGKIVKRIALQNTHDYLVVLLKGLPNGVYICKFVVGNKILEAQKLVINQ